jgi:hypothetical protein
MSCKPPSRSLVASLLRGELQSRQIPAWVQ